MDGQCRKLTRESARAYSGAVLAESAVRVPRPPSEGHYPWLSGETGEKQQETAQAYDQLVRARQSRCGIHARPGSISTRPARRKNPGTGKLAAEMGRSRRAWGRPARRSNGPHCAPRMPVPHGQGATRQSQPGRTRRGAKRRSNETRIPTPGSKRLPPVGDGTLKYGSRYSVWTGLNDKERRNPARRQRRRRGVL